MKRLWLAAGLVAALLLAAPLVATPARAGETSADEEGYTIAEGEDFSLNAHFLMQFQAVRDRREVDFAGALYSWFNRRGPATGVKNVLDDRVRTTVAPTTSFDLLRARAIFEGHAFKPWLRYEFEVETSGEGSKVEVLGAYVQVGDPKRFSFTAGQFKTPFDLFQIAPEWKLRFADRSTPSLALTPGYDVGGMFTARSENGRFVLHAAIQDGSGLNRSDTGNDPQTTLRLEFQNKGGFDYDLTSLTLPDDIQYTLGVAWLRNYSGGMVDEATGQFCVDGISDSCVDRAAKGHAWEVFAAGRVTNLSVSANYQKWTLEDGRSANLGSLPSRPLVVPLPAFTASTGPADLDIALWQVEVGFMTSKKFEVVARFAQATMDDESYERLPFGPDGLMAEGRYGPFQAQAVFNDRVNLVAYDEQVQQQAIGFNYYLRKHNAKLHFDWSKSEIFGRPRDDFYAYVPDEDPAMRPAQSTFFDFLRREGKVTRSNPAWTAFVTFYL